MKLNDEDLSRRPDFSAELSLNAPPPGMTKTAQPRLTKNFHQRLHREISTIAQKGFGGGDVAWKMPMVEEDVSLRFFVACIVGGLAAAGLYKFLEFKRNR